MLGSEMQLKRILLAIGVAISCGQLSLSAGAPPASASSNQVSILQDDNQLQSNPGVTLANLHLLGDQVVKVAVSWDAIAPGPNSRRRPPGFDPANPAAYPPANWAIYDEIDRDAHADGIQVYLDLEGGGPRWAEGPGQPPHPSSHPGWEPSPSAFEAFTHAVGARYDGTYTPAGASTPLPRVSFWSVWNEPNLGAFLSPQGVPGDLSVENSGRVYRNLLEAAWAGLQQTGHGEDTFLTGELAPRGGNYWGKFQAMKPLVFLRALYCVDSTYRELRGAAAAIRGCPTTAAGSKRFRAKNPALFKASGLADHMWMRWYPPNRDEQRDPNYSSLADVGQLVTALDRVQRIYGSTTRLPVYDTEFGYITDPPNAATIHDIGLAPAKYPRPATAAYYLNWAEYLSWKNPRIMSFDEYLLSDPPPDSSTYTAWSSGLLGWKLRIPKSTYAAWRLPLYLPVTSAKLGHRLEVWGCIRPATYGFLDTGLSQIADIQFAAGQSQSFTTVRQVSIGSTSNCYFDVRLEFPRSGSVRLTYTYPSPDSLLPSGYTVYSRPVAITLH